MVIRSGERKIARDQRFSAAVFEVVVVARSRTRGSATRAVKAGVGFCPRKSLDNGAPRKIEGP